MSTANRSFARYARLGTILPFFGLAGCEVDECESNSARCTGSRTYSVCEFKSVGDHGGHTEWRRKVCPVDAPFCRQAQGIVTCLPEAARACSSSPLLPAKHVAVLGATIGDVNGDAYSDVALVLDYAPLPMVAVALGTSGRFESHLEVGVLNGRGYSHWLVVGDFDGDTFPDLAVTASGGIEKSELRWWRGDGTGAFSVGGSYELAGDAVDLAAGDLDGDGKAELLVAEDSDPQVTVLGLAGSSLLALGQMKQVTGPLALLGGDQLVAQDSVYRYQGGALVLVQPLPITGSIGQVEVADFDLDGISDLAVAHSRWAPPLETPLEVHLGSASGEFTRSAIVRADWGFTVADVDRNGTPDLVSRTMDGRIGFYGNQGGTGFGGLEQRFPQSAPAAELRTARLGPADGDDTVVMLGTLGTLRGVGDDCFAVP